jgi:hypothetical protein
MEAIMGNVRYTFLFTALLMLPPDLSHAQDTVAIAFNAVISSNAFDGELPAQEPNFTVPLSSFGGAVEGEVVHVGRGCPAGTTEFGTADPYLADPVGKIALIERGTCRFDNKIAWAQLNGASAVIIYNNISDANPLLTMGGDNPVQQGGAIVIGTEITVPAVFTKQSTGFLLRDGTAPVMARIRSVTPFEGLETTITLLGDSGVLNEGLVNALRSKLENAERQAEEGHLGAAEALLNAFINQVLSLVASGDIPSADGEALVAHARAILAGLGL